MQGTTYIPESSGVCLYIHTYVNHPQGSLHMYVQTYIHTHMYIDKGYIYGGGSSRRPFLILAHPYVHAYIHMYVLGGT